MLQKRTYHSNTKLYYIFIQFAAKDKVSIEENYYLLRPLSAQTHFTAHGESYCAAAIVLWNNNYNKFSFSFSPRPRGPTFLSCLIFSNDRYVLEEL